MNGAPVDLVLKSLSQKIVPKVWGIEYWICNSEKYCLKLLEVKPGYRCSLHYHNTKDETFLVLSGQIYLEYGEGFYILQYQSGQRQHLPPGTPHRFSSNHGASILEISTHHDDTDVVRLSESGPIPNEASYELRPPETLPQV